MVVAFLLRSAARSASLSRFPCTTSRMKASGIAANRYLTTRLSSSSSLGSKRSSTGNGNNGSTPIGGPTALTTSNKDSSTTTTTSLLGPSQSPPTTAESVYVHPLSQIVLLHLQSDECHEWITRAGLVNLTVHRDGTFSLETLTTTTSSAANTNTNTNTSANTINTSASASASANTSARIWTAYCPDEKKHWLIYSSNNSTGGDHISSSFAADDNDKNPAEATTPTTVRHRFLLQDNLKTAWNGDKNSLPVRIQEWVRDLMLMVR
jgi:hypothetical protein